MTTLCYLFDLAGDFYSYANNSDYLIDWAPFIQLSLLIGCLSFLWRGTAFFYGTGQKGMENCIAVNSVSLVVLGIFLLCESAILSL